MKDVKFERLKENTKGDKVYMLFEVLLEERSGYCVAVLDNDLSVEGVGNDFKRAEEMYGALYSAEASAIHIRDVISDMRNEIFV